MKYVILPVAKKVGKRTVYQIEATAGRGDFHPGELGGFIEDESNLSQQGTAWIHPSSVAFKGARICGSAVLVDSIIEGKIKVEDVAVYGLHITGEGEISSKHLNRV